MTKIMFAKESDCEENPGGHDLRATLVPQDVGDYLRAGFEVTVQKGLGEGVGFLDRHYSMAGAHVEHYPACYSGKDLVVKLKGPGAGEIEHLSRGTTLFSMGHLYCFPKRRRLLADKEVRLIGMETLTWPAEPCASYEAGIRHGGGVTAAQLGERPVVRVREDAEQRYVNGLLRAMMRGGRKPLRVLHYSRAGAGVPDVDATAETIVTASGAVLRAADASMVDLAETAGDEESALLQEERAKPGRAIGQVREVGMGGAKYGLQLFRRENPGAAPVVVVLGYGNVSMGAFELLRAESADFTILGPEQTRRDRLPGWLTPADLIVNGAETPGATEYIITKDNAERDIKPGAVVIDLIGGSPAKRSPVEPFEWTTFLPHIHFEDAGRFYAGLWGWDMYHSMYETALEYSRRIKTVLTATERYAESVDEFFTDFSYAAQLGA